MSRSSSAAMRSQSAAIGAVLILAFAACKMNGPPPPPPPLNPVTLLPTDPSPTCVVTPTVFATWFHSKAVTLNGAVDPADSVGFSNPAQDCPFYQWSEQMFLWLTSPTTPVYGGNGLIIDSPAFFDVSPPAADGSRTFLPHTPGLIRAFPVRASQVGPQGLQLIFDTSGRTIQVKPAEKGATPLVRTVTGQQVAVAHVRLGPNKKPILLDANGNVIQAQPSITTKSADRSPVGSIVTAQQFIIDTIPIFIDPSLAVVDVEQGQAITNGVLEAQTTAGGSLVYYATIVNDVYAYFATGQKDGAISATQFPTTQAELNGITSFASAHGETFADPNALAIEVKSAWVVAAGLPNLSSYITMTATIPTYNESSSTTWTPSGQQTVQLALVGMHVVGSVAGHPEMIWATFEHFANAPRAAYQYINTGGTTVNVNLNTTGSWVFAANGASAPFNNQNMSFNSPDIVVNNPPATTISPSNTIRWKAFGAGFDLAPNPLAQHPPGTPSSTAANTEVISIDNSVGGMLVSGDLRANYIMSGATWTEGGAPPSSEFPFGGNQVGTSSLANTTMETYVQGKDNTVTNGGMNCLSCHVTNTTGVSHVYGALRPLF